MFITDLHPGGSLRKYAKERESTYLSPIQSFFRAAMLRLMFLHEWAIMVVYDVLKCASYIECASYFDCWV